MKKRRVSSPCPKSDSDRPAGVRFLTGAKDLYVYVLVVFLSLVFVAL
jgi:hypothetical protein